ncbi:hypothetical protein N7G274_004527 [Stereocaulon virgatum]|uniref:SGNH hydrolase-type esterase domain-containing protein n=1 Tax=Stereocaulon virgatum TaxID=373712 RepID=A0ABR4ACH1_9LECA
MHLRILCFGASITAGWSKGGTHFYPYSSQLSARIADEIPSTHFGIDLNGLSGDTLIDGHYTSRMYQAMKDTHPTAYDWTIIQAGGNDLAQNKGSPEQIFDALKEFWEIPLSMGSKVLALTVTEHGNDNAEENAKRQQLNDMVLRHQAKNFFVVDLAKGMPWQAMPLDQRMAIWSDDTHFTKEGNVIMGDLIADRLIELTKWSYHGLVSSSKL